MGTIKNDGSAARTRIDPVGRPMTKSLFLTLLVLPLLVACARSGVSRLLPTDDTRFDASARPARPPAQLRCSQTHQKPAERIYCKRQHWFRWRVANIGDKDAFALCHIQAFAHNKALTKNHLWLPWAGRNVINAGDVARRHEMIYLRTTRRVTRYALSCHAAMWTNGAPI
jgi:hypothetical protein